MNALSLEGTLITLGEGRNLFVKTNDVIGLVALASDFTIILKTLKLIGVTFYNEVTPPQRLLLSDLKMVRWGRDAQHKSQGLLNEIDDAMPGLLKVQSVLLSAIPTVVVWQESSLIYLANQGYGTLTQRPPLDWVDDPFNIHGWAEGELSRMTDLLDRHGFLTGYDWKIHHQGHGDELFDWHGNIKRTVLGKRAIRITEVLAQY